MPCEAHTDDTGNMSTRESGIHPVARVFIGAAVAIAAGFGALVTWFIAIVTFTGCFIGCSEPNELGGMGLMVGTAALVGILVAGLGFAFVGWSRERMLRLWLIGTGVGAILGIATLVAS